ncbi:type IV pilus assembly protein PilM [Patescibacteria group bacterium]|nr:type IV pilus assembly protein PilM [Patescibacteria group bacterium]
MLEILVQKPETFGLDISDLSLKMAKLEKKKGGLKLASFGAWRIPSGIIKGGEVRDKKTLAEIIKKALREVQGRKIKLKSAICSLPEEKSFLDVIRLPQIEKEELRTTVGYEIENYIPLPIEQVYFDCEIIEPVFNHPKYIEVLIAATPKKIVDSYLEVLKMGGLKPRALEVECLAIGRALVKSGKTSKPLLIIDFGETRTTFIIFSGRSLRFTSTIPVSSQKLTESISKTLKVNLKKAEELKLKHGLEGEKKIFEAMIPPLTDLVEQIKTHLDYYHSHEKEDRLLHDRKEMEKILLCGGGSLLKGLVGFLASNLKIGVKLGNPWVNILTEPLKEVPELPFEKSLGYTTALGLALRGVYGY